MNKIITLCTVILCAELSVPENGTLVIISTCGYYCRAEVPQHVS